MGIIRNGRDIYIVISGLISGSLFFQGLLWQNWIAMFIGLGVIALLFAEIFIHWNIIKRKENKEHTIKETK